MNEIILIGVGLVIFLSVVLYLDRFRGDYLSHFTIIAGTCFLVEVFAPFVWLNKGQTSYRGIEVMEYLPQASLYFVIGYIFFCVVYFRYAKGIEWSYAVAKEEMQGNNDNDDDYSIEDISETAAWITYFFFLGLYILYLGMRGRSVLSQLTLGQIAKYTTDSMASGDNNLWFLMVSLNATISVSILLLFIQQRHKWISKIVYVITFLFTISAGYRHLMLDMLLAPIIIYYGKRKKRVPLKTIVLGIVAAYLLVSWIGAMRGVFRTGQGELTAFESESAFESFMINIEVFFPYFAYTNYIPNYGHYSWGGTYIVAFLQLIPSIIWPGKSSFISWVKNDSGYKGMLEKLSSEGIADNFWCEGFKNAGVVGIVIVFSILGKITGKLRKLKYSSRLSDLVIYAISVPFMFQILTRSFQNALQDGLFLFLPFAIMRLITRVKI